MPISTLIELQEELIGLSHDTAAIEAIERFSAGMHDTARRIEVFNAEGALLRRPICPEETRALGFSRPEDDFALLQGDVVSTESAFYLGERVTGNPKYTVLSSSCDIVPGRRQCAALLRVTEIRKSEADVGATLNLLLKFRRRDSMYLPPLSQDGGDVVCNVIQFDGICQIRSSDLLLAKRIASLSVVGWRIFSSFSRAIIGRANPREGEMRLAIEKQPRQQPLDLQEEIETPPEGI